MILGLHSRDEADMLVFKTVAKIAFKVCIIIKSNFQETFCNCSVHHNVCQVQSNKSSVRCNRAGHWVKAWFFFRRFRFELQFHCVGLRETIWNSRHGSLSFIHCRGNVFNTLLSFNTGNFDWKILSIARPISLLGNGGSHLLLDSSLILVREQSNLSWYFFQYWRCETSNLGSLSFFLFSLGFGKVETGDLESMLA